MIVLHKSPNDGMKNFKIQTKTIIPPDPTLRSLFTLHFANRSNHQMILKTSYTSINIILSLYYYVHCTFFTAEMFLKNMDPNISPCHNFYDFMCGNFKKWNPIEPGKAKISTFTARERYVNEKILGQ